MSENENTADSGLWPAGTAVFFRDDPGRKGHVIGSRPKSDGTRYQVRWEAGATSWHPKYALEKREEKDLNVFSLLDKEQYGRLRDLRRNITFIQLSGKLADMVYSMDTTNTEFLPYQYKPVLAFLKSPSNGILIADEVGLGKTIEAGLIWTELQARHDDARRLVVVCPAMLREKWCDELKTRFGVDAVQLGASELRKELARPWYDIPSKKGYVCSLQGLRQRTGELDAFEQSDPVIDLLIIDEAHHLRNPGTQSARLGESLRNISKHVVLLSATPINLRNRDLFSLLNLVDPDAFEKDAFKKEEAFSEVLKANGPLIEARQFALDPKKKGVDIIEKLKEAEKHPLLKNTKQLKGLLARDIDDKYLAEKASRIDLANRIDRINLLSHTVNRTRKTEVEELGRVSRDPISHFVPLEEPEMEFYRRVTNSIRGYAQDQAISDGFLLATPQRMVSSCMYAAAKSWRDRTGITGQDLKTLIYENSGVDLGLGNRNIENDKVFSPLINHIANEVLPNTDINALRETDTKYKEFSKVVHEYLKKHPEEKIVVFSYFKGTLHYLSQRLGEEELETQLLHGGIDKTKQEVIDQFREDRKVRVLLASEVASEGVDLQFSKTLINYDLPWNPMKIEQRIGRIDRIGQQAKKIVILNFGCANTIDERIYERLLVRLGIFERALGDMEAILGEKIQELTSELLNRPLTPKEEEERIENAAMAIENNLGIENELEKQAYHLFAHGGYILRKVKAAHEFKRRITDQDLMLYVKDYLDRFCQGHQFIMEAGRDPMKVKIQLPPSTAAQFTEYIDKHRLHGQSRLSKGNPVTCRFENKVVQQRSGSESINQLHPFVRFISAKIQETEQFYPLIAVEIKQQSLPELELSIGIYAFSAKRWAFDGLRKEEHLRARAVRLDSDELLDLDQSMALVDVAKVKGRNWFSVANEIGDVEAVKEAFDKCDDRLEEDYQIAKGDYENENADRVTFQIRATENRRDRILESLKRLLQQHKEKGNEQAAGLTESRIRVQTNELEVKIEELKLKRDTTSRPSDVVYGVIQVAI